MIPFIKKNDRGDSRQKDMEKQLRNAHRVKCYSD